MKRLLFIGLILLAAIATVRHAEALEVVVGKTTINLAGPQGYCPLDKKNPLDGTFWTAMQKTIQGRNELLAVFAACDRLKSWRAGKTDNLGDFAGYQVSLKAKSGQFVAEKMVPVICAEFRKQGSAITDRAKKEITKNINDIEEFAGKLQINSQKFYGVLHESKTECYTGIVQKIQVEKEVETIVTVAAVTVIKGKLLFFNHTGTLADSSTVNRLLKTSRATIKAALSQN